MHVSIGGASSRGTMRSPTLSRAAGGPRLVATHAVPLVSGATAANSRYPGGAIGVSLVSRNRSIPVGVPTQRLPSRSYSAATMRFPLMPAVREKGMVSDLGETVSGVPAPPPPRIESHRRTSRPEVPMATTGLPRDQARE